MGTVANLSVKIGANAADFNKGIAGLQTSVDATASKFRNLGVAIGSAMSLTALAGAANKAIETASRIADMAERVGISAEAMQRLEFAATQAGGSFDAVATSIRVMSTHLTDGDKGAVAAMTSLGLSLDTLRTMAPDQAFTAIADAIARVPDPIQRSALATELFGRGAQILMPAILAGFTEIGNAAPVMANSVISSFDQTGDKWAEMQQRINNLKAEALLPLMSVFTELPASVQLVTAAFLALLPSLQGIGVAVIALGGPGAALSGLGAMFTSIGASVVGFGGTLAASSSRSLPRPCRRRWAPSWPSWDRRG
jgi:hypothetical protein